MFLYKTTPVACCCKAQVNGSCFVMELWDKAERLWTRVKNWKTVRGWHIWKLKLVDARLYFVSMFVGLQDRSKINAAISQAQALE